jgi:inner membrane protein
MLKHRKRWIKVKGQSMIFFGHLGITTGIIKTYEIISENKTGVHKSFDYRFVLVGSILPDLIDKPLGVFILRNIFHNSRIFAHTLIFSLLLLIIGLILLLKSKKSSVLLLGISSTIHLILDSMWLFTGILFWPIFGFMFPQRPEGNWIEMSLSKLLTDPSSYIPEMIGFMIILYFTIKLIKTKQIGAFLRHGIL